MRIVLIGGSNTRSKNGWTPGFINRIATERPQDRVLNLSVGATSSVLGTWRILGNFELQPGDVLIWEYALNDMTYIAQQPELEPVLLRNVEQTIRHCARQGVRMAPLLFMPMPNAMQTKLSSYHRALLRLFRVYGVEAFDLTLEFRRHLGHRRVPRSHYENRVHYRPGDAIIDFTIEGALDLIDRAAVPRLRKRPIDDAALRPLAALTDFKGGRKGLFENSMLQLPIFHIGGDAANGPLRITLPKAGRIAGIIHFATAAGTPVRVSIGDQSRVMSTRIDEKFFSKPLLKAFLWECGGETFRFEAGDVLQLGYAPGEAAQINPGYRVDPPQGAEAAQDGEGSFGAILAEYDI